MPVMLKYAPNAVSCRFVISCGRFCRCTLVSKPPPGGYLR